MAKLTKRQKDLCKKYRFAKNKFYLIYAMCIEGYFVVDDKIPYQYINKSMVLSKKYTLKDLDEMLDYKQLRVQDFCEMKEY